MAALGNDWPTLLDQIKLTEPDGSIATVVEALSQRNDILQDAPAFEGNLPTGHRLSIREGLPSLTWRKYNQGTTRSKSKYIQVDETAGMLNGRSEVDKDLAELNGNEAAFRATEDKGFLMAMNNEVSTALFYHSTKTDPEKILGWAPRYRNTQTSSTVDGNSKNVITSGITPSGSDQGSIWFITWGPETAYLIYPKGSTVGLDKIDMGLQYIEDSDVLTNGKYLAYVTDWTWKLGLCIKDWRYHVRVCNIDASAFSATGTELIDAMTNAYNHVRDLSTGRTVIYMNRTVKTFLERQINNKPNMFFGTMDWHGVTVSSFRGLPINICDALTMTESVVPIT